jgi:predicted DNA-binding transcriptional regulator YafY
LFATSQHFFKMDITKRFDRILKIFFLLQSKSVVTLDELKERFGISERTIYRDLKSLESAGVPILNEAGAGYSIMEGFRIQPAKFTQEEMLSLVVAEKIMQKHETQFIKQHFDAALIKIKGSFRFHQKDALLHLEDKLHFNENAKAGDYLPNVLDVLLNSILKKKIANIHYIKSNDDQVSTRKLEPVGVFYEGNNWYVLAWCHLRKEYRNFRLDRIKKIDLSVEDFILNHLPIQELRANKTEIISQPITIRIDRKHAHNLSWERNNFGFEKEEFVGEDVIMHFNCCLNTCFFVRWFMMVVDMGEILTPVHLQQELMGIVTAALDGVNKKKLKAI